MFSELPKLFDRNFVIAYFLPVSILVVASAFLIKVAGIWAKVPSLFTQNTVVDATIAIFTIWILSVLLMVLNRDIYRILEGYGKINPLRIFENYIKKDFEKKVKRLEELDNLFGKKSFTADLEEERAALMENLAQRYPDQISFLLPTAFGNAIRAFEVYPRVMYGMEGIDGWSRILTVVPKEYRELIEDAKTQVDWWVNLSVASSVFLLEFWIMSYLIWSRYSPWYYTVLNVVIPLLVFSLVNWVFMWRAVSAVIGWGDYVKSSFDLYRFQLLDLLGVEHPTDRKKEKEIWESYSQAIIFRLPDLLPKLKGKKNNVL